MKIAVVIAEDIKQVVFTPETEQEKVILKLFNTNQDISLEFKSGTFYEDFKHTNQNYNIALCSGGYVRAYEDSDSLMLVLKPKNKSLIEEG
jgi:hypothetical protein